MSALDLSRNWQNIRDHFNRSFTSNFHCSIASVDDQGQPIVTPIGSLFLNADRSGFYFEKYPTKLPRFARNNPNISVLAVNSGVFFWLRALMMRKFSHYPGVRLSGMLGESRPPTELETKRLQKRMRVTRWLKGNRYLWGDMRRVRLIHFTSAELIQLGHMTKHL